MKMELTVRPKTEELVGLVGYDDLKAALEGIGIDISYLLSITFEPGDDGASLVSAVRPIRFSDTTSFKEAMRGAGTE